MPTNYPSSIDSYTNPTPTSPMNSPSHAGEHDNINDAMVAIQTALGITGAFNFLQITGGTMSGAIAMSANKITGVANGSSAQDVAAFGQIPTALPPNGGAGGSLTGSYPNPTIATIPSAATGTTQSALDNSTKVSTTAYTDGAVSTLSGTVTTALNLKAPLASPAFTGVPTTNALLYNNNAVAVSSNAATVPVTYRLTTVTNNAAASVTITITTSGATDGQMIVVRFYDYSAVAQTIAWTNTENSQATAPTTSNGSTTLPLTVGFMFNSQTTKWRCLAAA